MEHEDYLNHTETEFSSPEIECIIEQLRLSMRVVAEYEHLPEDLVSYHLALLRYWNLLRDIPNCIDEHSG